MSAKLVAISVGIISLSVAGAAALFGMVSQASPVVIAVKPIPVGQMITTGDLGTAAVAADGAVSVVPAAALDGLVGQRAAVAIPAGALLTADSVTPQPVPGPGEALVGVSVTSAQAPLAELDAGTPVQLVWAPTGAAAPLEEEHDPVPATVVSSGAAADGARVVDVAVAADTAATVTRWAASGSLALFVDSIAR